MEATTLLYTQFMQFHLLQTEGDAEASVKHNVWAQLLLVGLNLGPTSFLTVAKG